jgi:hypothetical protein
VFALILVLAAFLFDLLRGGISSPAHLLTLGDRVTEHPGGIGWLNALIVWLIPQQLGIAWKQGRFSGRLDRPGPDRAGSVWLTATVASGYPIAMVGIDLDGNSNMLPPTLALIGVMWLQVGLVLLLEKPARWLLDLHAGQTHGQNPGRAGHAALPVAQAGRTAGCLARRAHGRSDRCRRSGRSRLLDGPAGLAFAVCSVMVAPVLAAVVSFELRRKRDVPVATSDRAIIAGGVALLAGLVVSLAFGAMPGALIGLIGLVAASWLLRAHPDGRIRGSVRILF